jgi:hypothetical protein
MRGESRRIGADWEDELCPARPGQDRGAEYGGVDETTTTTTLRTIFFFTRFAIIYSSTFDILNTRTFNHSSPSIRHHPSWFTCLAVCLIAT